MSGELARYAENEVPGGLSRYVGNEVVVKVYNISASLVRGDNESAKDMGEELLDSMRRELSTNFMFDPEAQALSLEISRLVGNIHRGEDTTYNFSRVYGEIGDIVPWIKKDYSLLKKDDIMLGNYPVY